MTSSIDRFFNIKNPYNVLGILPTAKQTEIKKAYRAKARITHPDRNPLNEKDTWEKCFQDIREAYEILSNPNTRKELDEYLYDRKISGNAQFENFWNKVRSSPAEIKSEIARKRWYDEIKLQNEHATNFKKEWSLGTKKKRVWIYAIAGIILTVGFSLVVPSHSSIGPIILDNAKDAQTLDWQNMLDNPQSAYCDPPDGEQSRYCFYQNFIYVFNSDDGVHWYKWVNSQVVSVDLSGIPTSQTGSNSQAYSNAMGYHFCANKHGNYLVFDNCLQLETTLSNR